MITYDAVRLALRAERMARNISQRALAETIGVAESTLANWENEGCEPVASNLFAWVASLEYTITLGDPTYRYDGWIDAIASVLPAANALHAALENALNGPPRKDLG